MINIEKVDELFNKYLDTYDNQDDLGFDLKVVHTLNVVKNAKMITEAMGLDEEDIELAVLIAYLHDIGRFEELKRLNGFESVKNDHALYASKALFENNLIREFIEDNTYDNIIKKAIENHNKLSIESGLSERELLHAKIIRDADKLDNFRVKKEEEIEEIFPGKIKTIEEFNNSLISDKVYQNMLNKECVDIRDRIYPLDYWLCILAFVYDLNFKETFMIVKENDYMNVLIDRFNYNNIDTKEKMERIRLVLNDFIDMKTRTR